MVLQHPSEAGVHKASLPILSRSLAHCQVIVDEDFTDNSEFNQVLAQYSGRIYLLYPHQDAINCADLPIAKHNDDEEPLCLVLLDGTWKKAYKMFQLSNNVQKLPKLILPDDIECFYQIRKTDKKGALSTLEACYHALTILEEDKSKYQGLIDGFVQFNQHLLRFVPKSHQ